MTRGLSILTAIFLGLGAWTAPAFAWPVLYPLTSPDAIDGPELHAPQPAVVPNWRPALDPENALFVLEEAAAPFLGTATGTSATAMIALDAPGYQDLFTVHFPLGSARLSLAAQDMTAMTAEAARGFDTLEIWVSAGDHADGGLRQDRLTRVRDVLLANDVPASAIHLDDGSLEAILNRPERLATDPEA
jgi:hypothetical protein